MDCKFLKIQDVLKDFYIVPDYQREFVWTKEQIEQLLEDIASVIGRSTIADDSEDLYFIGSIVVFQRKINGQNKLHLIDGQQRLTTLFLTLCAIKALNVRYSGVVPGAIDQL